ncbi:hypothetical protein DVH24_005190 [Malus domestica]|uniref:Uncharacterized protein n=1 Tax=Malus domestica TaxID=3750 RepID=A0A498ICU1_MALDO|nr:hypothetical protein DVH24_005190 [Malus domestica]
MPILKLMVMMSDRRRISEKWFSFLCSKNKIDLRGIVSSVHVFNGSIKDFLVLMLCKLFCMIIMILRILWMTTENYQFHIVPVSDLNKLTFDLINAPVKPPLTRKQGGKPQIHYYKSKNETRCVVIRLLFCIQHHFLYFNNFWFPNL